MRYANVATSGSGILVAGRAGSRIVVHKMILSTDDTESFHLRSGVSGTFHVGDNTTPGELQMIRGHHFQTRGAGLKFQCDLGADLRIIINGAFNFAGCIVYGFTDPDDAALA